MKALGISELRGYARYVSTQTSYSLADRTPELELVPLCLDQGVGIIPYFPLAGAFSPVNTVKAPARLPAHVRKRTRTSIASWKIAI